MSGVVRCGSCAGLEARCPECMGTGWTAPPTPWLVELIALVLCLGLLMALIYGCISIALLLDRN